MRRPVRFRSLARALLTTLLFTGALTLAPPGRADPITITRWTVDGGGSGFVQLGPIIAGGTIGQPDAGIVSGLPYVVSGGFWIPNGNVVGVDDGSGDDPGPSPVAYEFVIRPVAPNPMAAGTGIEFEVPEEMDGSVEVFDLGGRLLRTVARQRFAPGPHRVDWDVTDAGGRRLGAGLYLIRVRIGTLERSQKVVVLR